MSKGSHAGRLIRRGEPGFDEAVLRTSYSAHDPGRRPEMVFQAHTIADVVAAVAQARAEGLRVSICSGGHAWSQNHIRDGGLLLDVSRLDSIAIDADARTATVGPGCLSGDLNKALLAHDLFFPIAHAYGVGMGGFLLQGGFGWNSRMLGLACESVFAVDVVLADGSIVQASASEHPELLWAARGSGPGFVGAVVAFHLKLHRRPRFTGVKVQVFRIRHLEDVVTWAHEIAPRVSPKVEFQMVFNRRALGIFAHGIEVISPVLADSRDEAREAVSFITNSPLRRQASLTLPLLSLSLNTVMRAAEKVVFPPNTSWFADNMWVNGPVTDIMLHLRRMADRQPPAPSHALWMNWNPHSSARPDMAFSLEGRIYLALYGGLKGVAGEDADREWATETMRAMEPFALGIQLADENLARRSAPFLSSANIERLDAVRCRYDPGLRFQNYGDEET